jgi:hypothetical protein
MADPNVVLRDPRRRGLVLLGAAAAIAIVLAALSLWHQASLVAPKYVPESFFSNLMARERGVARIHIESHKYGAFDIDFKPSSGWVLPGEHDYPADFALVHTTLVGMAGLETIAPKTSRADWLHYLDLGTPSKNGHGTLISLLDEHGKVIASLIAGKTKDIGEPGGATGLFVRKPDSNQSWLVRSVFTPKPDPNDWLNKDVIGVDRARIREAVVTPSSGPAYTVRRDKPSDSDFTLAEMPKGRTLSYNSAPDGVAAAIVGFTFDKVAPASRFDFTHASRLVTRTFDGLVVTAHVIKMGDDYWATLSAEAKPDKTAIRDEAHKINKRASGWAFRIPSYKGAQFMTARDSLLKPVETKRKKARRKTK